MKRKAALRYITSKLNEGIPKHVIYRELLSKVFNKEDALSYISEVPDTAIRAALKKQNRILIGLLVFLLVLNAFNSMAIVMHFKTEYIPWLIFGGGLYLLAPLYLVAIIKMVKDYRRNELSTCYRLYHFGDKYSSDW